MFSARLLHDESTQHFLSTNARRDLHLFGGERTHGSIDDSATWPARKSLVTVVDIIV